MKHSIGCIGKRTINKEKTMVTECTAVWGDADRAKREVNALIDAGWKVKQYFCFRSKKDNRVEYAVALVRKEAR